VLLYDCRGCVTAAVSRAGRVGACCLSWMMRGCWPRRGDAAWSESFNEMFAQAAGCFGNARRGRELREYLEARGQAYVLPRNGRGNQQHPLAGEDISGLVWVRAGG
jgi:hypothetical protein